MKFFGLAYLTMRQTMRHVDKSGTGSPTKIVRRFLLTFAPLAFLLLLGSLILYSIESNALKKIVQNQEVASLDKQENLIKSDFEAIVSDILYLATQAGNHSEFKDQIVVSAPDLIAEFLEFARYKGIYDQVRLLDIKGMEKIRVNYNSGRPEIVPTDKLQPKGRRYYFTDTIGLGKGEVFVSPFDLNIENGQIQNPIKPMIRFGTPVYDSHGVKLGVIILNYLGSQLNNKLRGISTAVPGSNMLLNSDGYWILSPIREDEWGFMFSDRKDRTYRIRHPGIWNKILGKKTGQFFSSGSLFTFNTIYPLKKDVKSSTGSPEAFTPSARPIDAAGYYWILLSNVPKRFFRNEIKIFVVKLTFIDALLLVLLGVGSWMVSSARVSHDQLLVEKQILIDELQEALSNIRTLSGLIPICASCKNIRDDKGYWSKIESYIGAHSDAEFSHSICPACAKELYPDLYPEDD